MNPIYCIGCRTHIPRTLSNTNRGLCSVCIGKIQAPVPPPVQPQFQIGTPQPPPVQVSPIQSKTSQINPVVLTLILSAMALLVTFVVLASVSSAKVEEQTQVQPQQQNHNIAPRPQYVKAQANIYDGSRIYAKAYDGTMVYYFTVVDAVYNGDRRYILVEYPNGSVEIKRREVATNENMWTDSR